MVSCCFGTYCCRTEVRDGGQASVEACRRIAAAYQRIAAGSLFFSYVNPRAKPKRIGQSQCEPLFAFFIKFQTTVRRRFTIGSFYLLAPHAPVSKCGGQGTFRMCIKIPLEVHHLTLFCTGAGCAGKLSEPNREV